MVKEAVVEKALDPDVQTVCTWKLYVLEETSPVNDFEVDVVEIDVQVVAVDNLYCNT